MRDRPRMIYLLVSATLALLCWGCSGVSGTSGPGTAETFIRAERELPDPYDKPDAAFDFFLRQRLDDGESYPIEHLRATLGEIVRREHVVKAAGSRPGGILGWQELGPGNIGGRTRALAVHPDDGDIVYAGGVSGGVWRSTDGGATWQVSDDLMLNLSISCLVVDPVQPEVLYAGTGEGYFWSWSMARGLGIFKSTDGGDSWTQLEGTVHGVPEGSFHYVNDLEISSQDRRRVWAATSHGVWRSDDGGDSWTMLLANTRYATAYSAAGETTAGCTDVALAGDGDQEIVLAAFGVYGADGLYRSDDGGDTWQRVLTGPGQGRMTLAVAPSRPRTAYVCMAANAGSEFGRLVDVYRSTDAGLSWQPRVDMSTRVGRWLLSNAVYATGCATDQPTYHQGWYDSVIAVDPLDADIVWVGGIDLFRSTDGGRNFHPASFWWGDQLPAIAGTRHVHADQHALVFHSQYDGVDNQVLYSGNDGGIARTDNARATTFPQECPFAPNLRLSEIRWTLLNHGYGVTQFYHGDSARQADVFAGGTQDNGTPMVDSRSGLDSWRRVHGGDGGYVAIDPRDPEVFFAEQNGFPTIVKTTDGGRTFAGASNGIADTNGLFITPFAMDPGDPEVLWTGGTRPWRTTNGGDHWQLAGPSLGGQVSAIAVAPSDGDVVYMGLSSGGVVSTGNGLAPSPSWSQPSADLPAGWVSSLAVDPYDADVAYCTLSTFGLPHVFKTTDGGLSWSVLGGAAATGVPEIPAHWIAVRPCNRHQLYLGTELGVFTSDDQGHTWEPANQGLAHTVVECLDFKDDHTLVAFTRGRGAFLTALEPCPPERIRRGGRRVRMSPL